MATTATQTGVSTWRFDPAHSSVEFSVKHLMMTTVRGRFKEVEAILTADEEHPEGCCVEATITAASIDTGVPERDAHLRGPDFLDAERYPNITFRSQRVEGDDTTMEVRLDCVYEGRGTDPWGKERAGLSANTELDRREWGLRWNQALETGGLLVGNTVKVDVEARFVKD